MHRARVTILTVLGLICFVLVVGFFMFVAQLAHDEPELTDRADGIVALTGGPERIIEAVDLLSKGHGKRLLVTGVNQGTTSHEIAKLTPKFHDEFGCCIDLDYEAANTVGNADAAQKWARAHHMQSLIIVTSSYHMPRALVEMHRALPDLDLIPYPVVSSRAAYDEWWADSGMARLLFFEYLKYLGARIRAEFYGFSDWKI
ncbi:YdcF family protein [Methylovirgula sp. 4M-Z18]|uniref:YdcF family protein n=1 Tax=Methylovirgula sp. 4M-Z18 TaxID=2293567 RepID=UPI00131433C6|nr:YdcF family protein [Methylovirgula sp. 4M-Z18]